MAAVQHAYLAECCGGAGAGQCCSSIAGVWYLCLAILVMVLLISCNDLLMSRCYFIGFPWSKTKLYNIHETTDEEVQLLLFFTDADNNNVQQSLEFVKRPPPPPYSAIEQTEVIPANPAM